MLPETIRADFPRALPRIALASLAAVCIAAHGFDAAAAEPGPLPPPPELLDGGYAIDAPVTGGGGSVNTGNFPRHASGAEAASPYPGISPRPQEGPAQTAIRAPIRVSPPSRFMPDDYFLLPMADEAIPGVLLPELDEDFAEPGALAAGHRRRAVPGMSDTQLEPYFAKAKGSEKAALEAQRYGDDFLYRKQLARAIDRYMEIINMADPGGGGREEAWYGVARCEYRRGNWWRAFDALEHSFPEKYDRSEVAGRIRLEMFIGERLWRMGEAAVPDARKDGGVLTGYQAASRVYAAAIFNKPNSSDAPLALLRRGDAAALEGNWDEAAKFYRTVIHYYPESEPAMQARSSLAESVLRQEWPSGLPEAGRKDLGNVMEEVERSERKLSPEAEERRQRALTLANDREAGDKLRQAKEYMKGLRLKKSRDAAVFLLGDIVSHYPHTTQAREAAELLLGMGIEPPVTLSDGNRFPLPPVRSPNDMSAFEKEPGGGSFTLGGQDRETVPPSRRSASFSPARPSTSSEPIDAVVPGVSEDM